ncbi:MAG: hypothetical protein KAJ14_12605, partial [Candidatus Omnitrophica bacterium]|nr:hypothetical protein [Candidatus Omnitrophota bacterium]
YLAYNFWLLFGWNQGAMFPLQVTSALFGAGGVLIFYNILKGLFRSKIFCFIGSLFFAFSYGYWFFSTEPIMIISALFFRLVGILIFVRGQKNRPSTFFFMGLAHGVSIVFDSQGVLFSFVMIYGIYLFCRKDKKSELFKKIFIYLSTAVLITGIVYFVVSYFYFNHRSIQDFLNFVWGFGPVHNEGDSLKTALYTFLQSVIVMDKFYLLNYHICHVIAKGVFIGLFLIAPVYLFVARKKIKEEKYNIVLFSSFWILFIFPIYCYKEPLALELYSYLLPPFWFIFIIALWEMKECVKTNSKGKKIFDISVLVLLFSFITHNFVYGIFPQADITNCEFYKEFVFLKDHVDKDKIVIVLTFEDGYVDYSMVYLNNETKGGIEKIIPVSYFRQLDFDYENLFETVNQYDNLIIFFLPVNIWKYDKQVEVSNIIQTVNLIHGESQHIGPEQEFLNKLSNYYNFTLVSNDSNANCTLFKLLRRR